MRRLKDTCYVPITHAYAGAGKDSIGGNRMLAARSFIVLGALTRLTQS